MEANKLNLAKIFTGYTLYKVPFYQRSYVWEEDKWSRFLTDMVYVSSNKKSYFLGSIILKQENTVTGSIEERLIIDGQQRFTTIILFFKAFSLKAPDFERQFKDRFFVYANGKVALEHSINDVADFTKVMNLTKDESIEDTNPSKIIQAFNYFQRNIKVDSIDYHALISSLTLIGIDLNQEDDEQMIFDTINSLSEPLTTGELLKNYFFKENSREEYEELWQPVFEKDNETVEFWNTVITQGRLGKTNIDTFFNAFLQIKVHNHSIPGITSEYRARIKRTDRLFRNYKELINDFNLDKTEFIYELIDYAEVYKDNISQDIEGVALTGRPCIERINFMIKYFDCSTLVPYILYITKNVKNKDELNNIYSYLENYITRRVIAKSSNNNYSDLFTENLIGGEILSYQALRDYIERKGKDEALAMPTDNSIIQSVRENEQNNKRSLAILYMLETRMRSQKPHSTTVFPYEAYSLEHLMPKKWLKHWSNNRLPAYDDSARDHYIKTLGNHTLLNSKLNTSISNSAWQTKLYGNSKNKGLQEYAIGLETIRTVLDVPDWNEVMILSRADWLADQINKVWLSYLPKNPTIPFIINVETPVTQEPIMKTDSAIITRLNNRLGKKLIPFKGNVYKSEDGEIGLIYIESKLYQQVNRKRYWYGYRPQRLKHIKECKEKYIVYAFKETDYALLLSSSFIDSKLQNLNVSINNSTGEVTHWHIVFYLYENGHVTLLLSRPNLNEIDMDQYKV